jgi:acetyl-CoA carboxylase biotin carboxyl carrier protein
VDKAKLKELLELFEESGIAELEFRRSFWGGTSIRLQRHSAAPAAAAPQAAPAVAPQAAPVTSQEAPAEAPVVEEGHMVRSPMVGTMYHASSPDTDVFVKIGDQVAKGQTLCIIEAMKIMNEIESDAAGRVKRILVGNGDPVEYNQPLVELETS